MIYLKHNDLYTGRLTRLHILFTELTENSSVSSFEVCSKCTIMHTIVLIYSRISIVPTSRRAVIDLLKLIFPLNPYNTKTTFMTENDVYNVVKEYLPQNHNITAEKLNYWIGQEGYWPGVKRKQIKHMRKSGRLMNSVNDTHRGNKIFLFFFLLIS